jgi:hypothetical protein
MRQIAPIGGSRRSIGNAAIEPILCMPHRLLVNGQPLPFVLDCSAGSVAAVWRRPVYAGGGEWARICEWGQ